jgi:hypothetical protein
MILGKDTDRTWVVLDEFPDESYFISPIWDGDLEHYQKSHSKDISGTSLLTDPEGYLLACLDHCLHDWKGIKQTNGKDATCNKKNKLTLIKASPKRAQFIINKANFRPTFQYDMVEMLGKLGASSNGANGQTEAKKTVEPV